MDEDLEAIQPVKMVEPKGFDKLTEQYSSIQLLGVLGALQLNPINHGRNVRFEQLSRNALMNFDSFENKPLVSWEILKETIENYTDGFLEEYPLSNFFSERALFEEGNYIV